ncbi:hypothetical protein NDI45_27335 [Leptolyngbya sp. GB1-A1]
MTITNLIRFNNRRGDIFGDVTTAVVYSWLWTSALPLGWGLSVDSTGGLWRLFCRPG